MMHGPCGKLNPDCSCMHHKKTKGHCKYGYPKQFTPETTNNSDGYPEYRRRNTGDIVTIRNHEQDNRWVIPYNPYLMTLFDCHLNVEVCSTIQAVKYLYKYVYKGHDKVSFNVTPTDGPQVIDEIERFQSGRWVSPCEAMWRIYGFDLYEMHPPVMALQIHLANMQSIQMRLHEHLESVLANEKRARTPLTAYFEIYNNDTKHKIPKYLYGEFPEYYRWDAKERVWFKRKTKLVVIGRLVFVAPSEGERYFLRMLLLNVRGPKSFEDLCTVDGIKCATFQEAALKPRLLEADNTVEMCLDEVVAIQMPFSLRQLFATCLIFCQPKDPSSLWAKFYPALSDDFKHKHPTDVSKVQQLTYRLVERVIEAMGRTMKAFGLDHLSVPLESELQRTRDIADALDAPIPPECIACISSLNAGQQHAFDTIMSHVTSGKPGAFFVDGPGGSGKTYLYNALYAEVRLMGKIVLPTATSGIAAANIPSGRTTHSRFKLPLDLDVSLFCDVPKQGSLASLIQEAALLIWDEASMTRNENVEALDILLRDLCDPSLIFGGKLIVFGGDFRQILPVVPQKTNREVVDYSLVSSKLWP
ncbi:uncharacterized protein LOC141629320 [Silene latifolia]|uniref:uncharacterized protein LOC141629320 n=1 Tax=Silene latifolia TaxID=37657 RepID=UPI003D776CDA